METEHRTTAEPNYRIRKFRLFDVRLSCIGDHAASTSGTVADQCVQQIPGTLFPGLAFLHNGVECDQ